MAVTSHGKRAIRTACGSGGELTLTISNIDSLPSKQSGIEGPCTGPEQRQSGADGCHENGRPRVFWSSNTMPHREDGNQRSCDRRPEARQQKDTTAYPKALQNGRLDRQPIAQRDQPVQDKRDS